MTGAASGIGRGAAIAFAAAGADVVAVDVDIAMLHELEAEMKAAGRSVVAFEGDISSEDTPRRVIAETVERFDRIDVLFNSAGIARSDNVWELSTSNFRRVLDVNLVAVFELIREALSQSMLRRRSGKIINVTSRVALRGKSAESAYAAAKLGVVGLTIELATELLPHGINVNAISPAAWTPMADRLTPDKRAAMYDARSKNVLGRVGEVGDVVNTVLFLASQASDYLTGQIIHVNGEPAHLL